MCYSVVQLFVTLAFYQISTIVAPKTLVNCKQNIQYKSNAMLQTCCCPFYGGGSIVVDLLIVTPIVGVCNCSMFCCTLLYVHSSFAIILKVKTELVAWLSWSSWRIVIVVWLFLAVSWVCLQFVIVVFPDHTHLLF